VAVQNCLPKFSIILVEDNPADAEMLRVALRQLKADIHITHFESGKEVLKCLEVSHPPGSGKVCDLMLLDLNLPLVSGFDVLQYIRSKEHLRSLPVVVMSGSRNNADISQSLRLGANAYIAKPTELHAIFGAAEQILAMLKRLRETNEYDHSPASLHRTAG